MPLDIVVGVQWGDEGKGRFVDLIAASSQVVARFNGGDNAGHTITAEGKIFKLHLIPSGIIHPDTVNVMGNGMVVNPGALLEEMQSLQNAGISISPARLAVSYAAHIITPAHRALDQAREDARGPGKLGTTGRGIGPAYTDKTARHGLRMVDMLDEARLVEKLKTHLELANNMLQTVYQAQPLNVDNTIQQHIAYAQQLKDYICDTSLIVLQALARGENVLGEGAQGTLLDLDLGTYPFVTSSPLTAAAALVGLGIGIRPVRRVIGVAKAFQTRVGAGPFPTEVSGALAARLRGSGANPWDEYGTTTGRPRRVGWLDGVLLRYAARVNGLTELVLTKLDILSGLPHVLLCTAYRSKGGPKADLAQGTAGLEQANPIYEELPGWQDDLGGVRSWKELPPQAQHFLSHISQVSGVPISQVSVGPERRQVVQVED